MIRKAKESDIDSIMSIYKRAREYMCQNGNPNQWAIGYPPKNQVVDEIESDISYVYEKNGKPHAVFTLIFGDDPTYSQIEGAWKNDNPYATIHGLASSGETKGCFDICIEYCKTQVNDLRIDTHKDNRIMQYLIKKHEFEYCGIIYLPNGSSRIAYSWTNPSQQIL